MKNPWIILGVIVVVLFGGAIWYSNANQAQNNEGIEIQPHIKGNEAATIELVEYSDFQCPACATFQPVIAEIMNMYGDQISFEYRHFPLISIHPHALSAAIASEAAAQQDAFFAYHDKLFENQAEWSMSSMPTTFYIQYAEELGLDVELFRRHINASVLRDKVRSDYSAAVEKGITSTPSFYLNGQKMEFDTFAAFAEQIAIAIDPTAAGTSSPATPQVEFGI
jgi:protein-disulfide isomerase